MSALSRKADIRVMHRHVPLWARRGLARRRALIGVGWSWHGRPGVSPCVDQCGRSALYRRSVILCLVGIAILSATSAAALAAESERCQELGRKFQTAKPQISAIEVSLALFSAADRNCTAFATELLDSGASVDARDRFGARPLSHAARFGHLEMVDLL